MTIIGSGEMECPHCGHFITSLNRCSYCGIQLEKRRDIKRVRVLVIVFSLVGLLLVYAGFLNRESPLLKNETSSPEFIAFNSRFNLADITPERAGEQMTIGGRVFKVWKPRPDSRSPYKIVLTDSSGSLDIVHWLKEMPEVRVGDKIKARGTIGVYQDRVQLKLNSTNGIEILSSKL